MERVKRSVVRRNKPGPKRVFSSKMLAQVELLAKLGATDIQLALFFDVDRTTVEYWLKNYPVFYRARKRGGMEADAKVVECLFKRATGYDFWEEESRVMGGELVTIKVKKHIVPDTKLIMFWLSNRQREQWTGAQRIHHRLDGVVEHLHAQIEDIPVEELTKEAQNFLFEIGTKQLSNAKQLTDGNGIPSSN